MKILKKLCCIFLLSSSCVHATPSELKLLKVKTLIMEAAVSAGLHESLHSPVADMVIDSFQFLEGSVERFLQGVCSLSIQYVLNKGKVVKTVLQVIQNNNGVTFELQGK